ncbi:folA [Symbiodinium natans]|uniref:dihydrofolate reductase n=1 Tax=Symbiodinium natans TaxID=878477 RepID=A0A812V6N0_9DINO|nr:folA [Symbiodinium natans]
MSRNRVIGKKGRLPWSIPEDFAYFLDAVRGDVCITGRKSYAEFGSAIPGAGLHIVLSKQGFACPDAVVQPSLGAALHVAKDCQAKNVWIAGGTSVYRESFPIADEFWATLIHEDMDGDTFFPANWQQHFPEEVSRRSSSDANFRYDFVIYRRRLS